MMKSIHKRILISACCMLLFTGCGSTTDDANINNTSTEAQVTEIETTEAQVTKEEPTDVNSGSIDRFSEITSIKIVDISDDLYEDKLEYTLTSEQVSSFIELQSDLSLYDKRSGSHEWYKLELYGKNDLLIDTFAVGTNYFITDSAGRSYKSDKLKDWLKSVTESYDMSISKVSGRQPSDNYFKFLSEGTSGRFTEKAETNFDKVLELELTETDIKELSSALENTEFSKEATTDIPFKYTIEVYNKYGAFLYAIYVDENMHIYTEYGYEITGGTITDWVEERIK